ncbi:hypothetical protein [Serratia marcescens]|uniref:hypothetical protein n=1 Tax=Serratia marcescens TaxID=615 RepID=UPI00148C6622|nr:hypothetical protein [Serratia marcescens]QJU40044.1 hypothetical protein HMI62_12245 [Serratia marcescens]
MKFIDDNIINEWVSQHYATINLSLSMALFDKLSALPWIAGHLDFSKLNHRLISAQEILDNDDENQYIRINEWLKGSTFEKCSHVLFWYGKVNPCVICETSFGLSNIDTAYWGVPGWNYIFSCDFENNDVKLNCDNILSFDGANQLVLLMQ